MIDRYYPDDRGTHTVKLTFNEDGFVGHISINIGGNCKGSDILTSAIDFLEECNDDDMANIIDNDCDFRIEYDDETEECLFSITLADEYNDKDIHEHIDEETLKNMLVSVEIIHYESKA